MTGTRIILKKATCGHMGSKEIGWGVFLATFLTVSFPDVQSMDGLGFSLIFHFYRCQQRQMKEGGSATAQRRGPRDKS